jgi:transcription elongation factor GreA
MDKVPMTPAGQVRLREELARLKDERPGISREIGIAREHGDLRENAEYHAAKEKQGFIEGRIKDLESALSRAEVIDPSTLSGDKVRFGAHVKLSNTETEEEVSYQIVGPFEADLEKGTISVTAPLARALIGKEVGDEVKIQTTGGKPRVYEILEVEYK